MGAPQTLKRQVCQFQTVSTEGFTPCDCAQFCAPPRSNMVANGNEIEREKITGTDAEKQRDSRRSCLVINIDAATVNRRAASSNLAWGANFQKQVSSTHSAHPILFEL